MERKTSTLRGYTSVAKFDAFELQNLNVLIGVNGANKFHERRRGPIATQSLPKINADCAFLVAWLTQREQA